MHLKCHSHTHADTRTHLHMAALVSYECTKKMRFWREGGVPKHLDNPNV